MVSTRNNNKIIIGFRLRLKNICALPLYLNVTGPGWGEETQIKFDKNPL